jgi:hypothetical protein
MPAQTEAFSIIFPEWYDDRAEFETPSKGYLHEVEVRGEDGSRYRLFFIDPVRLQQDLEEDCRSGRSFYAEPGMIVLPEVNTRAVQEAIAVLWREGYFKHMRAIP